MNGHTRYLNMGTSNTFNPIHSTYYKWNIHIIQDLWWFNVPDIPKIFKYEVVYGTGCNFCFFTLEETKYFIRDFLGKCPSH